MRGIELRTHGIGTELCRRRRSGGEELDRRERARIGEYHARTALEIENEARESWKRFAARTHRPVARHPKMHVQRRAIIEDGELMLPASLDAHHRASRQAAQRGSGEMSADERMQHPRARDPGARRRALEGARRMLDFRKLRHAGKLCPAASALKHAIDSAPPRRRE